MDSNCRVCSAPVEADQRWLLLNRYALGTGTCRGMSESTNDEGEYLWEMSEDAEEEFATGVLLHYPACVSLWIDAKMAEVNMMTPGIQ